jgi:L-lactate dehydrogenase complex protein LldF
MAAGINHHDFFEAARQGVANTELRRKLENSTGRHLDHVAAMRSEFAQFDAERDIARRIKEDAIGRLDELLLQLKNQLDANGAKVFVAADAAEARAYILEVARRCGAKRVVKGKSMTTEEIGLNAALSEAGIDAVETDLGEYIVQLRGERPSHIITPAIHLSKEDIGQLLSEKLEFPTPPNRKRSQRSLANACARFF